MLIVLTVFFAVGSDVAGLPAVIGGLVGPLRA
jgi:hypothetical protein